MTPTLTRIWRKPSDAAPKRLAALAKLPVFFDLEGKRVVMAGGTAAVAWKAELLAASGADVQVYATDITSEMSDLLQRGAASGTLTHHRRPWDTTCLQGAAMALADADNDAQAKAFYCAANTAGVPVNVIDKPAYCQFQFGSIVNRSPVVVSISTDGAAPILGQAIRQRIETLLPAYLSDWGRLAKSMRTLVTQHLGPGLQRRTFWERFSDAALQRPLRASDEQTMLGLAAAIGNGTNSNVGHVTLVGAGPGDAELLTLKAVRALQSADVILFDELTSDEVLELARREAKRVMVGKRGGRDSCRQEDINDLMVKLARQGKHVVRLKSGDPMIFGRAGEEIERLTAERIAVSIVPGITAATALAAQLIVSLTHRDHTHSVRYVTGHSRAGQLDQNLDWRGLADSQTALIFYMSGRTAPSIADRLILEGMPATTPVAIAISVSRPEMQVKNTTLTELRNVSATTKYDGPVLIAIGQFLRASTERTDDFFVPVQPIVQIQTSAG